MGGGRRRGRGKGRGRGGGKGKGWGKGKGEGVGEEEGGGGERVDEMKRRRGNLGYGLGRYCSHIPRASFAWRVAS